MSYLPPRSSARCIYCAFRSHQLALQARRHRSSASRADPIQRAFRSFPKKPTPSEPSPLPSFKRIFGPQREGKRAIPQPREHDGDSAGGTFGIPLRNQVVGSASLQQDSAGGFYKRLRARTIGNYDDVLRLRLQVLKEELKDIPLLEQIRNEQEEAGERTSSFETLWNQFVRKITGGSSSPSSSKAWGLDRDDDAQIQRDLRQVLDERGHLALDSRIKYYFYGHLTSSRFTASEIDNQKALADLRYPVEWYPATRAFRRTIHLHVGPTNSGKTYHALQALEKANTGIYAGPLRLLAHEVYSRMNAKGRACQLVTGEERRLPEIDMNGGIEASLISCTVEMVPINQRTDVAVIDEIQMIGNPERGWAWTQALLGVMAKEVHLCGEVRTVPLIQELAASMGEELIIHHYERLSPLEVAHESLGGDLSKLRRGDCIVSFSVMGIHALRKQIEQRTGKKVATVYGSLPPETRAQQARLFNDPDNDYDYLVASDAVGMGLNLAIKRIIFEASSKFDGTTTRPLAVADIKQIAGRAGRYRTAAQATDTPTSLQDLAAAKGDQPTSPTDKDGRENVGIVTTLENFDLPIVATAMAAEPEPIRTAGIYPPSAILERFAAYFPPGTPFSYIITRLHELSQMHTRFHLCGLRDQVWLADIIESVQGLSTTDRSIITAAPSSRSDANMWKSLMPALASCIAEQKTCNIADLAEMPLEILEAEVSPQRAYLQELERLHKALVTYLWLSYRFAGVFNTRALAFHAKSLTEEKIELALRAFSFSEASRKRIAKERQQRQQMLFSEMQHALTPATGEQEQGIDSEDVAAEVHVRSDRQSEDVSDLASTSAAAPQESEGGHISAEQDDVLFDEPEQAEVDAETTAAPSSSFAQWRSLPGNTLNETDVDNKLSDAVSAGQAAGVAAAAASVEVAPSQEQSSLAATDPATKIEASTEHVQFIPETELDANHPPLETQQVPPRPDAESVPPDTSNDTAQNEPDSAATIPPKHLAHLDVNATEAERDVSARP